MRYCIIGAGFSGIALAEKLGDAILVEKSNGIGGRFASRRFGSASINHGPEKILIDTQTEVSDPHKWIKDKAENLNVLRRWEVSHISFGQDKICVHSKLNDEIQCEKIIFTSPAPQTYEILTRSGISFSALKEVTYNSIIQFMVHTQSSTDLKSLDEYFDLKRRIPLKDEEFLGLFQMKENHLHNFMDKEKDYIKTFFSDLCPNLIDGHAHKWRYSEVSKSIDPRFQFGLAEKNIFLAGDYFGTEGVKSALKSIENLLAGMKLNSYSQIVE